MRSLKPEYQEKPLSLLSPIILSAGLVLWVWQDWWEASFIPLPKTREYLFKSGWKPTPGHFSLNRLWVETQLYETLSLSDDLCTPTELWYLPSPDEPGEPLPVILTFSLEKHPPTHALRCLNPLPPSTMGEYGLVWYHEQSLPLLYHIQDLPLEMQQQWHILGDALKSLSSPLFTWPAFPERRERQPAFPDRREYEMIEHNPLLREAARPQIEALCQALEKEDWMEQWQKIQRMARRLARGYYRHALAQPVQTPALLIDPSKKRERPQAPSAFTEQGYAPLVASLPMQAVINAIHNASSSADRWISHEGTMLHAPSFVYQRRAGTTIVSYIQEPDSAISESAIAQRLWQEVRSFDEKANDLLLDIFSHLSLHLKDGAAWFFAAHHLDHRNIVPVMKADVPGGKKRRAGHRKEDLQAIANTLRRLENIWLVIHQSIDVEETTKRGKKLRKKAQYTHEGRLLLIDERWYRNDLSEEEGPQFLPQKERTIIGWHIRAGDWLRTFLEVPNRQVARLCKVILAYDPYRQMWEKRLARYLLFHGHMHCHGRGGVLKRTISSMIEEVSLPLDRANPVRARDRFERAVEQLTRDKLIDGWQYEDEPPLPAKNWLHLWLDYKVWFFIAPVKDLPALSENWEKTSEE